MKPLVIYHTNESTPCADGFGAAFAAWMRFGDDAEYLPMKYGQEIPSHIDPTDRDLYVLDFSFLPETMRDFFEYCTKVVWLDHHASVFKDWNLLPNSVPEDYITAADLELSTKYLGKKHVVILDNTRSGAMIAWEYFHPGIPTPLLFQHLDDYDRWQFKIPKTAEFSAALQLQAPWNFEQWNYLLFPEACYELYLEGDVLLKAQAVQVEAVVKGTAARCFFRIGYNMYEGLAANCPSYLTNEVGHALANKSETFGMCWYQKSNGMIKVSLRSNGFNVLKIAKEYDGGGHKTAAGFEITNVTLQDLLCLF